MIDENRGDSAWRNHLAQVAYDAVAGHLDTTSPSVWHTAAAAVEAEIIKAQAVHAEETKRRTYSYDTAVIFSNIINFVQGKLWREVPE